MAELNDLCLDLVFADHEDEVINILQQAGYWDSPQSWNYYGNTENNYSIIGNQQSSADSALVEKIINSVDANLMKECLRKNIDPEGPKAPNSIKDALQNYFGIRNGVLSNIGPKERRIMAQDTIVTATGDKSNPCYSIIDRGEGQTPLKMPATFLSITRSNKLRIPFVQGKFNMGGTGAFRFCGNNNLHLLISKRDPGIASLEGDDGSSDYWGFTVIRRESPEPGMKNSLYKYLSPDGKVLMFKADSLPLLPGEYPMAYSLPLEWGSFIKLYEYKLTGLKSPVYFDLYYRLAVLLPNIALPILLYERRRGYTAKDFDIVLSGLSVRLDEDKFENIEEGFPDSGSIKIRGQEIRFQIYVFKREKKTKYARDEGIIFTVNGQSQGFISKSFFSRKAVGMSYLADSILIMADCSGFERRSQEDLFMNSRDRLCDGELKKEIGEKFEALLKNHQGLRDLKARRRQEEIEGKIGDAKPLVEVLEKVFKNSPTLSKLFVEGIRITNPFDITITGVGDKFYGKKFPTYFRLKKDFPKERPKKVPINYRYRIQLETDAENSYFQRDVDPGEFKLFINENTLIEDYSLNLWNGTANLNVDIPQNFNIGDVIKFTCETDDITRVEPFLNEFYVKVSPPEPTRKGGEGKRKEPPDETEGIERQKPTTLDLPNIIEVRQDDWPKHGFDRESALLVKDPGDNGYDFYINMDNVYLLTEVKGRIRSEPELLKAQFKYGMVLIGLSLLREFEVKSEESDGDETMFDKISNVTRAISPMLLPMISALSELEDA